MQKFKQEKKFPSSSHQHPLSSCEWDLLESRNASWVLAAADVTRAEGTSERWYLGGDDVMRELGYRTGHPTPGNGWTGLFLGTESSIMTSYSESWASDVPSHSLESGWPQCPGMGRAGKNKKIAGWQLSPRKRVVGVGTQTPLSRKGGRLGKWQEGWPRKWKHETWGEEESSFISCDFCKGPRLPVCLHIRNVKTRN